jgi:hypothetical protein
MTTALDLMKLALKDLGALGIGQPISPIDTQDAFDTLNQLLSLWQGERLSVYHMINVAEQATGVSTYSIGPGGDFDCPRPTDIKSAFVRLSGGSLSVDYPVEVIRSREDYDRIVVKNLSTLPSAVFYDATYPLGQLIWYPVPPAQYELHVSVLDALPQFETPADDVSLPPEYLLAIRYNLAICLAPSYQIEPTPTLQRLAANAKRVIKRMNAQLQTMTMPAGLAGMGGVYNVFSDSFTR